MSVRKNITPEKSAAGTAARGAEVEKEYFNLLKQELQKASNQERLNCDSCQRECGRSSDEVIECLANLMTIEFLLDHS